MRRNVITRINSVIMKKVNNRGFTLLVLLGLMLIQVGCARQGRGTNDKPDESGMVENTEQVDAIDKIDVKQAVPIINLFIENSASMNGFINQASGFQNAMLALTSKLKNSYGKDNLNVGFINASVVPQHGEDPYQLMNKMLVKSNFTSAGPTSTTDLNNLIKLVLNNTDDNTLSFFISDCIYSIKGTGTTPSLLGKCQNGTMDVFMEKMNDTKDLSMLFVRMESNFNGGYWDYLHPSGRASQQLTNRTRPYYLCVVGTHDNIVAFSKDITIEELPGYCQQYYLSGKDLSKTFFTVVSKPFNNGAFSVESDASVIIRRDGNLRFAIAVDLTDFPMTEEEKTNLDNYSVDGNFVIESIEPINARFSTNLSEKQKVIDNNCTHYIVVSPQGHAGDFTIHIKRQMPSWVADFSSDDDTGISNENEEELKKTFGIMYFVNGVADAYREKSREKDYYFTMSIKIKRN